MIKTNIGSLEVSKIGLGAMLFGTQTSQKTSFEILDIYADNNGNFIDTSNNYAFWQNGGTGCESETVLGNWLQQKQRSDFIIATKVGARPNDRELGLHDFQGLSKETIFQSIDESLTRLKTDYIDLYYAHIDDRNTPIEETLEAFDYLVSSGKVREIACSNYTSWRIEQSIQTALRYGYKKYAAIQQRHSFLEPKANANFQLQSIIKDGGLGIENWTNSELIDFTANHDNFKIIAYSPLLRGAYLDRTKLVEAYKTPENKEKLRVLDKIATELKINKNAIILAWMIQSNSNIIPLISASSTTQIQQNLAATNLTLTKDQMNRLSLVVD